MTSNLVPFERKFYKNLQSKFEYKLVLIVVLIDRGLKQFETKPVMGAYVLISDNYR